MSLQPENFPVSCAVSKQKLTGSIIVEGTVANQWYLQKLQNEVIPVTQGAGHVDTKFFQHLMSSRTSCVMCLIAVSCSIDVQSTSVVGSPGHHVHRT
jgi:hypothetical protein